MIKLNGEQISSKEDILNISCTMYNDFKSNGIDIFAFTEATIDCFNTLSNYDGLCSNKVNIKHKKYLYYGIRSQKFYFSMDCHCHAYCIPGTIAYNSIGYLYNYLRDKTYVRSNMVLYKENYYILNLFDECKTRLYLYGHKEPIKVINLIDEDYNTISSNPIILDIESKINILM